MNQQVRFISTDGRHLLTETNERQPLTIRLSDSQQEGFAFFLSYIEKGNKLNLLNIEEAEEGLSAEFIILEPEYLLDISTLAECFKPYGSHPLNYSLARLQDRENTSPILLGNTANYFIDELINEQEDSLVTYIDCMRKMFRTSAFEFSACNDLKDMKKEQAFFENTQKHFENIRLAINELFPKANIDKDKITLEPAFISNALGLQGRLDLMHHDFSAFIELKSGKAMEDFRTGQFIHSGINHYVQMILYLAVLEFNLNIPADDIRSYLLYSKYPLLSKEHHSRKQLSEALNLRNRIVAMEYAIQKNNDAEYTRNILQGISSTNLNLKELDNKLFNNYLAPSIDKFHKDFALLNEEEQEYFLRLYTFIVKELWLSKAGEREYEGIKRAANLWNAPTEEKIAAGEIMYGLVIVENKADSAEHTIRFSIPQYEELYLPNFREGDLVVLYEKNKVEDSVNNKQVFKGAIERLDSDVITIRLRSMQKYVGVWNNEACYAIEHDYMDTAFTGMFRSLNSFVQANPNRRDLLLGRRMPRFEELDSSEKPEIEQIVDKALAAKDCFLLVGPPGTGKTSLALKQMVEKSSSSILLLSYTNRAVDEIYKALTEINHPDGFIRMGNELSCAPEYREYLLEKHLKACNNRREVREVIQRCRIFVGTVASVWGKPELFNLKHFDLAIVDEATQLLEPHLLGILCAKTPQGHNAVDRFILIGDHKQLPAIVLQQSELSRSLFERLYPIYKEKGIDAAYATLSKQGRMHPDIAEFPSKHFYDGVLGIAGLPHQTESNESPRLAFYNILPSPDDQSDKSNIAEARQVVEICRTLKDRQESIGIITPFRKQIALIRKLLQEEGLDVLPNLVVDTVERFQGSQRDIIIYSFCIKTQNQLAALPSYTQENGRQIDRKLNVALTRARKQLYIIGNEELLRRNEIYGKLVDSYQ